MLFTPCIPFYGLTFPHRVFFSLAGPFFLSGQKEAQQMWVLVLIFKLWKIVLADDFMIQSIMNKDNTAFNRKCFVKLAWFILSIVIEWSSSLWSQCQIQTQISQRIKNNAFMKESGKLKVKHGVVRTHMCNINMTKAILDSTDRIFIFRAKWWSFFSSAAPIHDGAFSS